MQSALFHERFEDALDEVIRVSGGRKKVACDMWPDKPQRDAHNLMDACLNPERRERFSPRIVATRHEAIALGIKVERVVLNDPPVAVVSEVESIMAGWWYRAGGYPVGRMFGTLMDGIQ